jgi:hypothetical protein
LAKADEISNNMLHSGKQTREYIRKDKWLKFL